MRDEGGDDCGDGDGGGPLPRFERLQRLARTASAFARERA